MNNEFPIFFIENTESYKIVQRNSQSFTKVYIYLSFKKKHLQIYFYINLLIMNPHIKLR